MWRNAEVAAGGSMTAEITAADYRQAVAEMTSEADFQAQVIAWAKAHGWTVYHTHDSRRSQPGFPDLVMFKGEQLIFAELKTMKGKLSAAQSEWLMGLQGTRTTDCYVWRPIDWDEIEAVLS